MPPWPQNAPHPWEMPLAAFKNAPYNLEMPLYSLEMPLTALKYPLTLVKCPLWP